MNLADYNQHTKTKALIYGPPKSGKTALVGKLAEHFNLHWLDLENGVKTLLNPEMLAPKYRTNVNVINIPDHKLYPVAIDTVRDIFRGGLKKICQAHGKVNCPLCSKNAEARWSELDIGKFGSNDILVIDSLSQLSNSAINKSVLREISKPGGEEYKMSFHDYATQGALLDQVLSMIQVLDVNIAVISHEVESEMSDGKDKIVPMAGTRNFSKLVAKYFDIAVYCTILNKQHRAFASTGHAANVLTGSRIAIDIDEKKGADLSLLSVFKRT